MTDIVCYYCSKTRKKRRRMETSEHRITRTVSCSGVNEKENQVLASCIQDASQNVIFFPGDVQTYRSNMSRGKFSDFKQYSYEDTLRILSVKFPSSDIWIIVPSRFYNGTFSCFDNFVHTNTFGEVETYDPTSKACDHLVSLMKNATQDLAFSLDWKISFSIPIVLTAFSRGSVVLNQLVTELGVARLTEEEDIDNSHPSAELFTKVAAIHWIDSGNGRLRSALPHIPMVLSALNEIAAQVFVHTTAYQLNCDSRPWIANEVKLFIKGLDSTKSVHLKYFEDEYPSLENHFNILNEFSVAPIE